MDSRLKTSGMTEGENDGTPTIVNHHTPLRKINPACTLNAMPRRVHARTTYTDRHAAAGISAPLPPLETWPNQFPGYDITIEIPEYTAICPKTRLPDFGVITIHYRPRRACLELKSLKMYIHAYRDVGIFYENAVNRILRDVVTACRPAWAAVTGTFTARGGLRSIIQARYPRSPRPPRYP